MEFPGIIHNPKLISGTSLIARYEALTSTDQPAVVLVAPPAEYGAISLEAAHQALIALRQDGLPFPGCPAVLDYRTTHEGGTMLTLAVRGTPLAFSWPDEASEVDVLRMALQHATLLTALHKAGFSGLQPGFEDLRWDAGHGLLTVLGWEWVRQNDDGRQRDLEVAASLWIELLTGAAPPLFPPLTAETAWPAWQRVSLGTRRPLASLLLEGDASAAADLVQERIDTILRNWERPVPELLGDGLNAGEDFPAAMELFDLADRREPDGVGSFRLGVVQERASKRVDRLISDVRIGSYYPTVDKFLQLAGESGITGQERLRARRWWAITNAAWRLPQVDAPDTTEQQQAFIDPFLEVLSAAERHQVKTALNRLQKAMADLQDEQKADSLQFLEGDLRGCLRTEEAVGNLMENPAMSVELFEQAISDIATLPLGYRAVLISQIGDPVVGLYQATQRRDHQELVHRTVNEAQAALKANSLPLAEQKWNEVLRLTDRQDPKRADYQKELRRVRLRSKAISAGVGANPETVDDFNVSVALQALAVLRTAFPRDTWGTAQAKRWQKTLLSRLEKDPTGPAGAWLAEYWPKDSGVSDGLERAAPRAVEAWQSEYVSISNDDLPKTPKHVAERIQRLETFYASLAFSRQWLEATSSAKTYQTLFQTASESLMKLNDLGDTQSRLLSQFEKTLDAGVQPLAVLDEAERLRVELFDDVDRSILNLRAAYSHGHINSSHSTVRLMVALIESAWRANDKDFALHCCHLIIDEPDVPDNLRTQIENIVTGIKKEYDLSQQTIDIGLSSTNPEAVFAGEAIGSSSATVTAVLDAAEHDFLQEIKEALQGLHETLNQVHHVLAEPSRPDEDAKLLRVECMALEPNHPTRAKCNEICRLASEDRFVEAQDVLSAAKKTARPGAPKKCITQCERYLERVRTKRAGALLNQLADFLDERTFLNPSDEIVSKAKYALSILGPLLEDPDFYRDLETRLNDLWE